MEGYGYPYPGFQGARPDPQFLDHGDGYGEYYGMGPVTEDLGRRPSRSKHRLRRSRSRSASRSKSRSRSRSKSRSKSRSVSRSRSTHSRTTSRHREFNFKEPGFWDAFRVLYLAPRKHKKNTTKYLATQKRQDRVQELLKADGLGSKRWFFYPRAKSELGAASDRTESRDSCDQRVKVDGDFFRAYKHSRKVDADAPIRKLKRWELIFYKKLGFVQAV